MFCRELRFLGFVSLFLLSNHAKQDPDSEPLWCAKKIVKSGWVVKKEEEKALT
jgi:hypothetical protein